MHNLREVSRAEFHVCQEANPVGYLEVKGVREVSRPFVSLGEGPLDVIKVADGAWHSEMHGAQFSDQVF